MHKSSLVGSDVVLNAHKHLARIAVLQFDQCINSDKKKKNKNKKKNKTQKQKTKQNDKTYFINRDRFETLIWHL